MLRIAVGIFDGIRDGLPAAVRGLASPDVGDRPGNPEDPARQRRRDPHLRLVARRVPRDDARRPPAPRGRAGVPRALPGAEGVAELCAQRPALEEGRQRDRRRDRAHAVHARRAPGDALDGHGHHRDRRRRAQVPADGRELRGGDRADERERDRRVRQPGRRAHPRLSGERDGRPAGQAARAPRRPDEMDAAAARRGHDRGDARAPPRRQLAVARGHDDEPDARSGRARLRLELPRHHRAQEGRGSTARAAAPPRVPAVGDLGGHLLRADRRAGVVHQPERSLGPRLHAGGVLPPGELAQEPPSRRRRDSVGRDPHAPGDRQSRVRVPVSPRRWQLSLDARLGSVRARRARQSDQRRRLLARHHRPGAGARVAAPLRGELPRADRALAERDARAARRLLRLRQPGLRGAARSQQPRGSDRQAGPRRRPPR
jgi:hypothetical protein